MTTTYTTLLGYALPETGTLEGLWGDEVNDNITQLVEDSVAGYATASVAAGDWTLTDTGSGLANEARMMILIPTGSPGVSRNIIAPAHSKMYVVVNQSDAAVVLKGASTTGVTIQPYYTAVVVWNGADFEEISPTLAKYTIDITGGVQGSVPYQSATNTTALLAPGTAGKVLTTNGAGANPTWETPTAELPSQTGHAGEYLTTNGSAASWGNVNITGGVQGSIPYQSAANTTTLLAPGTAGQVLTSGGSGANPSWTTPSSGISLSADNTWTGTQSFTGSTSKLAEVLTNAGEVCTISATAATGTINFDVTTQSVLYYTTNASANWTVNFRGSSGTSLNTLMTTGQSVTVAFMVTQGSTAYYNNAVTIDGSSVTPKYQGGTAWTLGNASSIDAYVYTIIKTGSAAFTVLASQTQFK